MADIDARGGAVLGLNQFQRVLGAGNDRVATVELERDFARPAASFGLHLQRPESRALDLDLQLLDRRDEHVAAVGLAAKNG